MNYNQLVEYIQLKYPDMWKKVSFCAPEMISNGARSKGYFEDDNIYALFIFYTNAEYFNYHIQNGTTNLIPKEIFENNPSRPISVSKLVEVLRDIKHTLTKHKFTDNNDRLLNFFGSLVE